MKLKRILFIAILLIMTFTLTSCRVNWFDEQYDVPWYVVAIPTLIICCVAFFIAVRFQETIKSEGAQTFRKGRFDSFQTAGRDAVGLKRKENSDLCGGRQGLRPLTPQAFEKA